MESSNTIKCIPLNYNPQSNEFPFEEDKITFSSKFDSGNLYNVQRSEPNSV